MKIAILVSGFPPDRVGGMEIATYNIAKHLANNGHSIHIITSSYSNSSNENKFVVHSVNMMGTKIIGPFFDQRKILPVIKEIDPEIIHAQGISTSGISAFTAYLIKKSLKIPYVVYGRGSDIYPFKAEKILVKAILNNADSVIALTEHMKKEIQKISDKEVLVVPNGIDMNRFNDSSLTYTELLKGKTIIFIGNLRPEKGLSYLIEAMMYVTKKDMNTQLLIVGEGPQRENLEKLVNKLNINNRVTFSGKVTTDKVPVYLKNSDIFVLPSLQEGFPNVLLEAMASGLPVVATEVCGINEIIEDGKNGFLVKPQNSKEIAEKILLLLNNHNLRKWISKQNIKKASKYSWQRTVKMLEDAYTNA
ncbi:glycosyltransferase family 4 protein [Methanobacterium sp. MBAC-LM]|uniref:glycosyltransferase family 4 protein n=1 Tax=Methanobacterium sp. MBAC-LM TaxID=3412034 RepID=UPI003C719CE6